MKISCVGAGGFYFLGVLGTLAREKDLRGSDIVLYDVDIERCAMMGEVARRFSAEAGADFKVTVARALDEAVDGAQFVVASIGGTGSAGATGFNMSPTHINDSLLSAKYGVPQLVGDTGGPAAMMAAFRSIPIYLNICRVMERRAPGAVMINHANPMALLCRAMNKYSAVRSVLGVCHGVQGGIEEAARILGVDPRELDCTWVGTNHYYWFTRICRRGRDLMPELWKRVEKRKPDPGAVMTRHLSLIYGYWLVYPSDDHAIEFYPFLAQVTDPTRLPYAFGESHHGRELAPFYKGETTIEQWRRECESAPREKVLSDYRARLDKARLPAAPEDARMSEGLAGLIAAIANARRSVRILNIPNRGSIPNLPAEALVEVECVTDSCGVRPVYMGEAPPVLKGMLEKRFAWQETAVDAAVKGDRRLAMQAMMLDEMSILPEKAEALLSELLENSRGMLPQFGL